MLVIEDQLLIDSQGGLVDKNFNFNEVETYGKNQSERGGVEFFSIVIDDPNKTERKKSFFFKSKRKKWDSSVGP